MHADARARDAYMWTVADPLADAGTSEQVQEDRALVDLVYGAERAGFNAQPVEAREAAMLRLADLVDQAFDVELGAAS